MALEKIRREDDLVTYMNLTVMQHYLSILKAVFPVLTFLPISNKLFSKLKCKVISVLGEISVCSVAVSDVGSAYACKPCLDKVSKTRDKGKLTFFESEIGFGNFRVRLDLGAVTGTGN